MDETTWKWQVGVAAATLMLVASLGLAGCSSQSGTSASSARSTATTQTGSAPGAPPGAPPGGAPPGGGGPGASTAQYTPTGAYTLSGGSATKGGDISATRDDESGVLVTKTGSLTLANANVTTSGSSKSSDESSFYGLNAGVLAQNGGKIAITGGSVKTTGTGANDVFAYGTGSAITVSGTTIGASGQYAHGIMASGGGAITATNVTANTTGGSSAPVATDRGGGTIIVNGGRYTCTGNNSPAIYSTGKIRTSGGTFLAKGSEVVVIEGANSVNLNRSALMSTKVGKWGVMIYQSMSGDAQGAKGVYTQTGGTLTDTASNSPLFYVTNTTAVITLKGVGISAENATLLNAAAGQWGTSGSNGGTANLSADSQVLVGNLVADKASSLNIALKNGSNLTGAINSAGTAKAASLTLDSTSVWTATANSHLTGLVGAKISGITVTNIKGYGNTVTYSKGASANSYLGGKTYSLAGGGKLVAK